MLGAGDGLLDAVVLLGVALASPAALATGVRLSAGSSVADALAMMAPRPLAPSSPLRAALAAFGEDPGTCRLTLRDH